MTLRLNTNYKGIYNNYVTTRFVCVLEPISRLSIHPLKNLFIYVLFT